MYMPNWKILRTLWKASVSIPTFPPTCCILQSRKTLPWWMLTRRWPVINSLPFVIISGWWSFWTQKHPLAHCWKRRAVKPTGKTPELTFIFWKNIIFILPSVRNKWLCSFFMSFWCIVRGIFAVRLQCWWAESLSILTKFIAKNCLPVLLCRKNR